MKKEHKKTKGKKIFVICCIILLVFSIFKIGKTIAGFELFSLTNVIISDKSDTVDVNSFVYEKNVIKNDITFHKLGDSVTYKITIQNNDDENYTIKSINDDNQNEYITYEFDNYEGTLLNSKESKTFEITAKYSNEVMDLNNRNQEFSVIFTFFLEDSKGNVVETNTSIKNISQTSEELNDNSVNKTDISKDQEEVIVAQHINPNTSDNIIFYTVLLLISITMIVMFSNSKTKVKPNYRKYSNESKRGKHSSNQFKFFSMFLALAIIVPTMAKASGNSFDVIFDNKIKLMDKLVVKYEVDGEITEKIVKYKDTVESLDVPTKKGYTFDGWYLEDGTAFDFSTQIVEDTVLKAKYNAIKYNISYELDGGEVSNNPITYTVEDEVILNNPVKDEIAFIGWTGTDLTETTEVVKIEKGSTGDREYIAHYKDTKYELTATDVDSNSTPNGTYDSGTHIKLTAIDKEGYTFKKWSNDETTKTIEFDLIEDTTINPVYEANIYYIQFNSNDDLGLTENQTMIYDVSSNLTDNSFTSTGYEFIGWNTEKDGSGISYDNCDSVCNLTSLNEATINLYAQWKIKPVKYAVQIYGINQDVDSNGSTLGLTFGGATGASYNNSYVTHEYEEIENNPGNYYVKIITHTIASDGTESTNRDNNIEYLKKSNGQNVIRTTAQMEKYNINMHEMTWAQIAEVSDKTVFTDCMLCGDTKSVTLVLNDTIANRVDYTQFGDGTGILKCTLDDYYKEWNPSTDENSAVGIGINPSEYEYTRLIYEDYEDSDNNEYDENYLLFNGKATSGYSSSHIRSTLLGEDKTNINYGYAGDVNLDSNTCLYSCIEDSLKSVITPKRVKYITGTSSKNYTLHTDISDDIWLFSSRELYGKATNNGKTSEGIGTAGTGYARFSSTESKFYISAYTDGYQPNTYFYKGRMCYDELGMEHEWWMRSVDLFNGYTAANIRYTGGMNTESTDMCLGINFGFCIR